MNSFGNLKADYFRAYSNINHTTFWILAHVISDPGLHDAVKQEIDAVWTSGHLDIVSLSTKTPILENVFHECLRLKAGAMMGRKVKSSTCIGNKWLKSGASILIPSRQLHFNKNIWGPNPQDFDIKRFTDKRFLKHCSYRPFGGGVSWCPGRKIAMEQIFALIAILLHRFDISLSKDLCTEFSRLDVSTPALGVTSPADGMDIFPDIRPRENHGGVDMRTTTMLDDIDG